MGIGWRVVGADDRVDEREGRENDVTQGAGIEVTDGGLIAQRGGGAKTTICMSYIILTN